MNSVLLRIILMVLLLISLSGLATTASALVHSESVDSCCPSKDTTEKNGELPCSAPDCPCVSCMNLDLAEVLTLSQTTASRTDYYISPQNLHLSTYLNSIDYPPELI